MIVPTARRPVLHTGNAKSTASSTNIHIAKSPVPETKNSVLTESTAVAPTAKHPVLYTGNATSTVSKAVVPTAKHPVRYTGNATPTVSTAVVHTAKHPVPYTGNATPTASTAVLSTAKHPVLYMGNATHASNALVHTAKRPVLYTDDVTPLATVLDTAKNPVPIPITPSATTLHTASGYMPAIRPNTTPQFQIVRPHPTIPISCNLNPTAILKTLSDYPDPEFPLLLAGIAKHGASLGYVGPEKIRISAPNHQSIGAHTSIIEEDIEKEIASEWIRELPNLPQYYYCSPMGVVPKKTAGVTTGWRRIHDLSFPHGSSVNDSIPRAYGTLKYDTFENALRSIAKLGKGTIMVKRDIESAFKNIATSPYCWWMTIFEYKGRWYVDLRLPFGCRTSPFIFNLFSEGIHWALEKMDWTVHHVLDDFLGLFPKDTDVEKRSTEFQSLVTGWGFPIKGSKSLEGTKCEFLGLEIDTDEMEARLPPDKHSRAITEVANLLGSRSTTFHQLEKTLGFLSFCCQILPLLRPFLRNLFNMLDRKTAPFAKIRVSKFAREDLKWWSTFLPRWNRTAIIREARTTFTIATDASGVKGIGGIFPTDKEAFSARIPQWRRKEDIQWKEAYAVLAALALWGKRLSGCRLQILCDNEAVVVALNKRSIRGSAIHVIQQIFLVLALYDIEVGAEWIPSEQNSAADALSRFKKLTNWVGEQLDSYRVLPNASSELRNLRQELRTFYGTDSLPLQEPDTMQQSGASKDIHTPTFPLPQTFYIQQSCIWSQTGSQECVKHRRRRRRRPTSRA
jgi:Reverse transcriptase (RNA-dependent DNA polymerase)